jgi:hypothetical protein
LLIDILSYAPDLSGDREGLKKLKADMSLELFIQITDGKSNS